MGWRDELLEASLGNVPFKVAGTDVEAGRLHAVHRFAGSSSRPWIEDLGVDGEKFTVDAYVLGPDYLDQRRKLLEVCLRRSTALRLTLPTWTPRIVYCVGVRIRETSDEGGFARFELSFQVLDDQVTLTRKPRPTLETRTRADELETQAEASAGAALTLQGVSDSVREGAVDALREAGQAILALDFTAGPAALVSDVSLAARNLIDDAVQLATGPADLISSTLAAVRGIGTALEAAPASALEAYRALFALEVPALGGTSTSGLARDRNAAAVVSLVRQVALAGYARAAVANVWATRQDAERARDAALAAVELESAEADDDAYAALARLAAALSAALPPEGEDLPDLVPFQVAGDTTTLAIAYRLYDDAARDEEIRARNQLAHPGRVPAGELLEVLSR